MVNKHVFIFCYKVILKIPQIPEQIIKAINFIVEMMDRYNEAPEISGRILSPFIQSKGKRHYWGLKGKNYGFYTTNEQKDMEERSRQHRRLKSEYANYMSIPHNNYSRDGPKAKAERLNTEPVSGITMKSQNKLPSPTQQTNPEWRDYVNRPKLDSQRVKQKMRHLTISPNNMDINLKPRNIVLPEIKRNSVAKEYPSVDQGFNYINGSRLELNKDGNVVYYTKRDRSLNPTYCNSLGYPLPCYRYVG